MQFHRKFPGITVAVGEERLLAIPKILRDRPRTDVIVMDDAFQHRSVKAGLNILLTDYHHLFTRDWFLPTGNLRDARSSYKRAGVVVVTKAPPALRLSERNAIVKEIRPLPGQEVFFAAIEYSEPRHILSLSDQQELDSQHVLLVTGIANPLPLSNYIRERAFLSDEIIFPDHHNFDAADLALVKERFARIPLNNKMILTTEKDAVRLLQFKEQIQELPIYVIPIQSRFLFDGEHRFNDIITTFIEASGN
jgi:tetraacyldisaccharide 4'-kinase